VKPSAASVASLARYVSGQARFLAKQPLEALLSGKVNFEPLEA
jgi:hypothetical protein